MSIGTQTRGLNLVTPNDAAGQACKLSLPDPGDTAPAPLILWSHPHSQTQNSINLGTAYFANAIAWAVAQEGWMFAASNMHGDSWGNPAATTDLANLKTLAETYRPASHVILMGASMGGLATANAVRHNAVSNVVGAVVIDPVLDLQSFYTTQATYQDSIETAYGAAADGSDIAAKIAGRNPMAEAASNFTGIPWLLIDGDGDTTVTPATQGTPWMTKVAAAPESTRYKHTGGHLDATTAQPAQIVDFIKRCIA